MAKRINVTIVRYYDGDVFADLMYKNTAEPMELLNYFQLDPKKAERYAQKIERAGGTVEETEQFVSGLHYSTTVRTSLWF